MQASDAPVVRDLVLVGGGHSQVAVLKRFGMKPLPGVRVTVICRDVHTPYSGMLPGLVAGHYDFDDVHIDLGPLCRFAGARFFHDEVVGIDLAARRLRCRDRPPVPYDVVSINIGSTPALRGVPGAAGAVVPVKPISRFVERWQQLRERVLAADHPLRIATVGAGAGGVELTLAVQFALRRALAERGHADRDPEHHLFSASAEILPTHNAGVRRRFQRVLAQRGVRVHAGRAVVEVGEKGLRCDDGSVHEFDEVLWVTWADAAPWLGESGLAVDERGFVLVDDTLQSVSHPGVFAAGDVAAMVNHPREKAGVFAVRQGPPLERNLRRALLGRPLRPFAPQSRFLSLISTGDRRAVASRGGFSAEGRLLWRAKDWIDRRFMRRYTVLPERPAPAPPVPRGLASEAELREIAASAVRCAGCGAKVGATVLARVLARVAPAAPPDVLVGLDAPDDAAVWRVPEGRVLVQSVDHFRAFIDDPWLFGRIAANHCLADLYAMGAEPSTALAVATVPYAAEAKVEDTLEQLLRGALDVLVDAGAALVGGHTSEGPELSLGFAVSGHADPAGLLRKSGMRPGDRLVLTKAIGTGALFAADMRGAARGRWIRAALDSMARSNRDAARLLREHGASACTDVTGFGLLGHAAEMTRASQVAARLDLDRVPVLEGARETVARGIVSSLQPQNLRLARSLRGGTAGSGDPRQALLFDPQTSGGLLASIPAARAGACVAALREAGYPEAACIGEVEPSDGGEASISLASGSAPEVSAPGG